MAGRSGRWGWHQLDRRWAARLVELADIRPGDLVLDVGAGTGVMTGELMRAGAHVVAMELHPHRAALLRARFAGAYVTVVQADATDLRLPRRPFKVVANPPFAVTTSLLRRLVAPSSRLRTATLVLPTWVVTRWAAGRGVGGPRTLRRFTFAHGPRLPPGAFRPLTPVDTAVLLVRRV